MPKPYIPVPTKSRFYVPMTLAADFTEFLNNDIPHTVMDFTLKPDWYDEKSSRIIRGLIYPDSSKSRYANTDNNLNFRADVNSNIKKGDFVISEDGMVYLLDWEVSLDSNNAPSRALRCNMVVTMERYVPETTDAMGMLIEEERWEPIFVDLPANAYRYDGRPEHSAISGTPGVSNNALTIVSLQYNEKTAQVQYDDRFAWGGEYYTVIDVNYAGVNEIRGSGVLTIQCKKVAGGGL